MNNKKMMRKKRHPYASLAVFTIAAAGVINAVERMKTFVMDKAEAVSKMFKKKA